jgi:thioredoxin reductase (NADPH)
MNPVLLVVIADPVSRADMAARIGSRFGSDYTVDVTGTADAALQRLRTLRAADVPVAMVLADVRLGGTDGIQLLTQVRGVVPTAARIALADRGDRDLGGGMVRRAAVLGRIDVGLAKPVGPRDEDFFVTITEYLADWAWMTGPVVEAVTIVDDPQARTARTMADVLRRHGVPTGIHDPGSPEGRRILGRVTPGAALPVVQVLDDPPMVDPSLEELADQFGFPRDVTTAEFDLAIIGAGPAGLGAAVYGASEGLSTLVVEQEAVGGQAGTSSMIRNYLGFPRGLSGRQLTTRGMTQAARFGAAFHLMRSVTDLRSAGASHRLSLSNDTEVSARAVLLACGVSYRRLGVASVEDLLGRGVFYGAATGEAQALEGLPVYIVGAGNSAGQAAVHLARYASEVTVVVRGAALERTMSHYLISELRAHDRIAVRIRTEVVDGGGDGRLEWLSLRDNATGEQVTVDAGGLFILIGAEPRTDWLPEAVDRDPRGYVVTGAAVRRWPLDRPPMAFETSMPGVFAAGDVRAGSVKRVAAAAGEGAVAVPMIHSMLSDQATSTA